MGFPQSDGGDALLCDIHFFERSESLAHSPMSEILSGKTTRIGIVVFCCLVS